jgi:enoyl-CoA hydratase/carnithine racemase
MSHVTWKKDGTVAVVTMTSGENRHNPEWTKSMMGVFNEILADEEIFSLVLAANDEKFWSLGIDTDWFLPAYDRGEIAQISQWFHENAEVFRFLLMCPFPSIAAVTGHAFGIGIMLAGACDFRFMRADKGFLCFPKSTSAFSSRPR